MYMENVSVSFFGSEKKVFCFVCLEIMLENVEEFWKPAFDVGTTFTNGGFVCYRFAII